MKFAKIVFLMAAIATLGLGSCKKDEAKPDISGDWVGTWRFGNEDPSFNENWTLEEDGDLKAYFTGGSLYAKGSWELHGDDFECSYKPIGEPYEYTFTGTLEDDEIIGEWKENQNPTNGGTFEMYRQ